MKFLVKVDGKLIVEASDKQLAIEKANVFLADKNLGGFKGNEYDTEEITDSSVIPA
jgi:hypothetical protein